MKLFKKRSKIDKTECFDLWAETICESPMVIETQDDFFNKDDDNSVMKRMHCVAAMLTVSGMLLTGSKVTQKQFNSIMGQLYPRVVSITVDAIIRGGKLESQRTAINQKFISVIESYSDANPPNGKPSVTDILELAASNILKYDVQYKDLDMIFIPRTVSSMDNYVTTRRFQDFVKLTTEFGA